jgi:hypothetical protein
LTTRTWKRQFDQLELQPTDTIAMPALTLWVCLQRHIVQVDLVLQRHRGAQLALTQCAVVARAAVGVAERLGGSTPGGGRGERGSGRLFGSEDGRRTGSWLLPWCENE